MSSNVVNSTMQAASLAGLSNLLAQVIQSYQNNKPFSLDYVTLLQFVVFSLIATPPNVLWQEYLEEKFPADLVDEKGVKRLHKTNTAVKFTLDQTVGAIVNSYLFIAGIGALKGKDSFTIWADCQRVSFACDKKSLLLVLLLFETCRLTIRHKQDVWPLMTSGWKLWPLVSLLCFTIVPLNRRVLVGSTIGVFWGVFLSLLAAG